MFDISGIIKGYRKNKNMSLLANLNLTYETLADDPIEVGIHYGKSILSVFSPKAHAVVKTEAPKFKTVSQARASKLVLPQRQVRRSAPTVSSRANYAHYTPRMNAAYTQRELVGAL